MSFNGAGTFNVNTSGQPVVAGTTITSAAFNALTADLATGLSTAICKDGQTTITANIPFNSFKITNLGAGTLTADAARMSQLQSGASQLLTSLSGTDTLTATLLPTLTAYAAGNVFTFVAANTNTTAVTLNIDALGAKAVTRDGSTALVAGDIVAGTTYQVMYDGTRFQLLNCATFTNPTVSGSLTLSGGTANGVAYLNASKVVTTGSALTFNGTQLSVNGTFGAVGLAQVTGVSGVSQPIITALAGSGASGGYNRSFFKLVSQATTTGWSLVNYGDSSDLFAISTLAGSDKLTISQAGNVTINAPSSGNTLSLNGTGTGIAKVTDSSATGYSGITLAGTGTQNYSIGMGGPSEVTFGVANKWFLYDGLAGAMRMVVDSSGNLGLGVTPSAWIGAKTLEFAGGNAIWSNGGNAVGISQNNYFNGTNWIYKATAAATYYQQQLGVHYWYTAPSGTAGNAITFTQAMTLDASGNLCVGNTSVGVNTGGFNVQPNSNQTFTVTSHVTGTASGASFAYFDYNGGVIGSITQNGTTGVLYNITSDYRLKEFVAPVTGAGERIDALNPVEFDWKSDGSRARGFFAHEFQGVYPNSVTGSKDAVDEDGNPVYQTMQAGTSEVIADLVAEIKSLRARIEALELGNG